jgi:hypothetical protein
MGTKIAASTDPGRTVGMWSAIADAVEAGWGPTGRLMTVILLRGAIMVCVAGAVGGGDIVAVIRRLVGG